jgi:hypothetical protein
MLRRSILGAAALLIAFLGACSLLTSTDGLDTGAHPAGAEGGPGTTSGGAGTTSGGDSGGPGADPDGGARSSSYRAVVMADGPAAYFRFEDTTGNACANEVTGSRFNCVYGGTGVSRGAAGVAASAAVRVTPDSTINVSEPTFDFSQPYTLEFWVELDAPKPGVIASTMTNLTDTTRIGFTAFIWDTGGVFRTELWNTNFEGYSVAATAPSAGVWHHIVYGRDSGGDFSYFDGAKDEVGSSGDPAGNPKSTVPLAFTGFAGRVDELAWYDHALSSDRIVAHYGLN